MINLNKPDIQEIYDYMIEQRSTEFPEYTSKDKTDAGNILTWTFSTVYKFLADWNNRLFRNMFVLTAIDRGFVVGNAIERGYKPRGVISQIVLLKFTTTIAVTIPKGFKVKNDSGVIYETLEAVSSSGGVVSVYAVQGESQTEVFTGTGEANQRIICTEYPFVDGYVDVTIDGQPYSKVESIINADSDDYVYSCHADSVGRLNIMFGNGVNGFQVPNGASITIDYKTGKGASGNVGDGEITTLVNSLAGVTEVTNENINSTLTTLDFISGVTSLKVASTSGFTDSGTAYIEGRSFTYTSKNETYFLGVSLNYDVESGAVVSVRDDNVLLGQDLETKDEIRARTILISQTSSVITSLNDFQIAVANHPSIAWAYAYSDNTMVKIIAVTVSGTALSTTLKSQLNTEINAKKQPTIRYYLEDPSFEYIDVVIEIERTSNSLFDSNKQINSDPLRYLGVKQNIEYIIGEYLSPIRAGTDFIGNNTRSLKIYDVMNLINDLSEVTNAKFINFSKSDYETATLSLTGGSNNISSNIDVFSESDIGKYILINNSSFGNNGYYRIATYTDEQNVGLSTDIPYDEASVNFYFSSTDDILLSGNKIQKAGQIIVVEKGNSLNYSEVANINAISQDLRNRLSNENN